MQYQWDFAFLVRYIPLFERGILVTLGYTAVTVFLGLILGLLLGLGRLTKSWLLNIPLVAFIEAFRCTPLPVLLGIQIPATVAGIMTLSCYTGVFYAEIFRGGIISIEQGQWDAARALGLRRWHVMRKVILPQAVRRMIPPFVNQSITQLKNTSLVSTIAVPDLLYNGTLVTADTYRPLEVYTVVALIYFALLFPSTLLAQAYERRLARRPR
jgi:polar amino acid transport system permease protein